MVDYGEWGKWLENSASYFQGTANKLTRLFAEYGDKLTAVQNGSNSESIPNLNPPGDYPLESSLIQQAL